MYTNSQILRNFFTTSRTTLTSTIWVYFNYFSPSIFSFEGKKIKKYSPATITNRFAQMPVFYHVLNFQVFDVYSLKILNIFIGYFVQKIFSLINYFFVCSGNQGSGLVSTLRTFFSPGKLSISASEQLFRFPKKLRILSVLNSCPKTLEVYPLTFLTSRYQKAIYCKHFLKKGTPYIPMPRRQGHYGAFMVTPKVFSISADY